VFLVDGYAKQGGVLPILYSYSDYASLSIGKIKNLKTLLQIGEAFQSLGMLPEAVRFYEKVKQLDTRKIHNDRIFLNLGQIHYDRENYNEAELVARTFLKNFPRSKRVLDSMKLLAKSLHEQSQHDDALQIYQNILEKFPKGPSEVHYLIATLEASRNQNPKAIDAYKKSIATFDRTQKIIPDYTKDAHYKLGNLLYQEGEYTDSIDAFNTAIKLFPDHSHRSWSEFILADALKKIKNSQQASVQFNKLIKAKPGNELMKKAAQSQLKIMAWEKETKGAS
jgi:TolA-binding protein